MIYDSKNVSVNENSEFMTLLENVENRFEYNTMLEATAIVIAEQEENWNRFMQGVGLSELASVMEGEEIIYEGERLKAISNTVVAFFENAIKKLAEITKAFINKVQEWDGGTRAFLKKFEGKLKGATLDSYNGYSFDHIETPRYSTTASEGYAKADAYNAVLKDGGKEGKFNDRLTAYFYGDKKKHELTNIKIDEQLEILKGTSGLKKEANKAYNDAARSINDMIKIYKKAKHNADKEKKGDYSEQLTYFKALSSAVTQMHGTYLRVLGHRNRQAMAICTRALSKTMKKAKVEEKPEEKPTNEGFVNTEAFLGAIEFI